MAARVMGKRFSASITMSRPQVTLRTYRSTPHNIRRPAHVRAAATEAPSREDVITLHPANNITDNIFGKIGVNLHRREGHPLYIIRSAIYEYFDRQHKDMFSKFDDMPPIVSAHANFDSVLVPADHVSRSPNDTYYVNSDTVLRFAL
jgi:phenylalanyl-tRNA synthetase alpha chain